MVSLAGVVSLLGADVSCPHAHATATATSIRHGYRIRRGAISHASRAVNFLRARDGALTAVPARRRREIRRRRGTRLADAVVWLALDRQAADGAALERVLPELEAVLRFTQELHDRLEAAGVAGMARA